MITAFEAKRLSRDYVNRENYISTSIHEAAQAGFTAIYVDFLHEDLIDKLKDVGFKVDFLKDSMRYHITWY